MGAGISRQAVRAVALVSALALAATERAAYASGAPDTARRALTASTRAQRYTFAFADADLSQVADEILGRTLGLAYSLDVTSAAKITFRVDRDLTPLQLLAAFEAALEPSDIVLVRDKDTFILRSRARAKALAGLGTPASSMPSKGIGYGTATVTFAYAKPSEVAKALQTIGGPDPVVLADDRAGTLVLGGSGDALLSVVQLAKSFDRSGLEASKIRFFELANASADAVAAEVNSLLQAADFAGAKVVPLNRVNSILVFANTSQAVDQVANWIARLDIPSKDRRATLHVYRPKNVTAEALGASLDSVVGDGNLQNRSSLPKQPALAPAPISAGGGLAPTASPLVTSGEATGPDRFGAEGPARIGIDRESNTILIFAAPSRWVEIQRVLAEIDRPARQVMIEASVLEVTLNDRTSLGIDWSLVDAHGKLAASSINGAAGVVTASIPGLSVTYLTNDIKLAINALGEQGHVEVVSAPKVLALDNHPARLDVGDQVPVVTTTGQSAIGSNSPILNSVEYKDTGIILKVTPRIAGDNHINLDVDQEVSSVSQTTTSAINSPTIQQRKVSTSLTIDDAGVVAIGGLMSSSRQYQDTGIPLAKDLPIVGPLFRTSAVSHRRTELVVLLTARIASDSAGAREITRDVLADMHELERRGLLAH